MKKSKSLKLTKVSKWQQQREDNNFIICSIRAKCQDDQEVRERVFVTLTGFPYSQ